MRLRVDQEATCRLSLHSEPTPRCPITSNGNLTGLKASVIIPGRGEPITNGALVIDGPKIAWVGKQTTIPIKYQDLEFKDVPVLMPGLWDCHTHFSGTDVDDDNIQALFGSAALQGARAALQVWKAWRVLRV